MKYFLLGLIISVITFMLDRLSKIYVFSLLSELDYKKIEVLPFLNLVAVHNTGVSFGMFNNIQNGQYILSAIATCITIGLFVWMWRAHKVYLCVALGLIIGGAVGNIFDRVFYGAVYDFIDFYVGNFHWPAFNLADSAVFLGVARILYESFIKDEEAKYAKIN